MDEARHRVAERALWSSVGAEPTERWLDLKRTRTRVRVQEIGAGAPVLFVHGASNGGTSWASLAARLDGHRCIVLDRPGCALSPRLDQPLADMADLDAFADDLLVDVLDALELERADVVATSFGGYFALRAAAAQAERVTRLVLLGWSFGAPAIAAPLSMRVAMQPTLGRLALRVPPNERMARALLKQIGLRGAVESGRFGPVELAWFVSLLRDTPTMRNEIDTIPRVMTLRGFNDETLLSTATLERVGAPALLLWGEDDPMGGADIARAFAARLPGAQLEMLPGAGHAPWIDDPDHVAGRVREHLR